MCRFLKWCVIGVTFLVITEVFSFRCDRRPYGSTTQASSPDGRFKLQVLNTEDTYIPDQLYTVQITQTDEESEFTAFVISAEGDTRPDPNNPRRLTSLLPGEIRPLDVETARFSDRCLYSVEQASGAAKARVEVYWQAPPPGNGCVTLRAMVAVNAQTWFEDGAPLTRRLCEDERQPDDVTPQLNLACKVCDEAKYEISFTGAWSRNTHPTQYPENDWVPRFSDFVGASHSADFILWAPGSLATDGLKDLAEYANSSLYEAEIRGKIGEGVRTLIKGKGHSYPKMSYPSYAFFRADKVNHLVTTAVGISPSPDWFLGVTRFELCLTDNTWMQEREINLYPWDAGTDSGVSYESPNFRTFPQDAVSRVAMSSYDKNSPFYEVDIKDLHPFGKLSIKLVRTYHRDCPEDTEGEEKKDEEATNAPESPSEPEDPSRDNEEPVVPDPTSSEDCPMSQWQEWSPCEGICESGKLTGYKWRERYHLVDGIPVEKYDPSISPSARKPVSEYCKANFQDFEREECEESCPEDELTVERRMMQPVQPGHSWDAKRRDLMKPRKQQ